MDNNNNANSSFVWRWLGICISILKIVLWPLRQLSTLTFPFVDTDGLAPAVTAKAAHQCVNYLKSLAVAAANNNNTQQQQQVQNISHAWSTLGFAAVKQEAIATQSLVVVYLHSPLHSESSFFCTNVLNQEPVLSWLQQGNILATAYSIHTAQGAHLQSLLAVTQFPVLLVLQPIPNATNTLQLVFKAQGSGQCAIPHLLPLLHTVQNRHQTVLTELEVRRLQRQQEIELRRQQDEEYQATLRADQERERMRTEEQDYLRAQVAAAEQAEQDERDAAAQALQTAQSLIRPEPEAGTPGAVTLRFVLPTGVKMTRRFEADQTVAAIRAHLRIHFVEHPEPAFSANIGLSTHFPKQTFTEREDHWTLVEAGLAPQAVLMVQDLDA